MSELREMIIGGITAVIVIVLLTWLWLYSFVTLVGQWTAEPEILGTYEISGPDERHETDSYVVEDGIVTFVSARTGKEVRIPLPQVNSIKEQ